MLSLAPFISENLLFIMQENYLSQQRFADLPLRPIVKKPYKTRVSILHPIQALSLPITLQGKDVAGQAQTGTGKTMAFLTATFHHLLTHQPDFATNQPRALILAPTRELAVQINHDAELLAKQVDYEPHLLMVVMAMINNSKLSKPV